MPTVAELQDQIREAVTAGKWKDVEALSKQLNKAESAAAAAVANEKLEALKAVTTDIKAKLDKVLQKLYDDGTLDAADGVWYHVEFGDEPPVGGVLPTNLRLVKTAPKASKPVGGNGGGGGKKFDISSESMLEAYGAEQMPGKDKDGNEHGTFQEEHDASSEGNKRYQVRLKLLKRHGLV